MSDDSVPVVLPPSSRGLNRKEAFALACATFGPGAIVGVNHQFPDAPVHVGQKLSGDVWKFFGAGKTWEEAFVNIREVLYQRTNKTFVFKETAEEKRKREAGEQASRNKK
jgi:hypothetical protein